MRISLMVAVLGLFLSQAVVSQPAWGAISNKFEEYEGGSEAAEQKLIDRLKANFKFVQAAGATGKKLNRGTHSKGTCADGTFEVFDAAKAAKAAKLNPNGDEQILKILNLGLFSKADTYTTRVRFANGRSVIGKDTDPDVRALSMSIDLKNGKRQDFSMNSVTTFPIESLTAFNVFLESSLKPAIAAKIAAAGIQDPEEAKKKGAEAMEKAKKAFEASLTADEAAALKRTQANGAKVVSEPSASYRTEVYWSGTAFKHGEDAAVKYILTPCDGKVVKKTPEGAGKDYLQEEITDFVNNSKDQVCFTFGVQFLDAKNMEDGGKKLTAIEWVENPTYDWDAAGVDTYVVGELKVTPKSIYAPEKCDDPANAIDVSTNTFAEHAPMGRINRGRTAVEAQSRIDRAASAAKL